MNHENLKYKKYKRDCDARGWHFVPLIVTTDGAMGPGARRLIENLATKLQKEWGKPKGMVRAWIKMRLLKFRNCSCYKCVYKGTSQKDSWGKRGVGDRDRRRGRSVAASGHGEHAETRRIDSIKRSI